MRLLMITHAALILLGGVLFSLNTWQQGASFSLGGLLMFVNVATLAFVWDRILRKKLIALALFIIVIKYALLGIVLYKTFDVQWLEIIFFALGIGSFGLAAAIYALISPTTMTEAQGNA